MGCLGNNFHRFIIGTRRTSTTDDLVKQMFSWIEESKSYVDKVRELAEELEPSIMNKARNKQQQAKKKLEGLIKEANKKDKESKKNLENIKKLLNELKEKKRNEVEKENEMNEMEEEEKNEVDRRVMYEVLRAIVRRSRPEMTPEQTQSLCKFMDEYLTGFFSGGLTDSFDESLLTSLSVILAFFGFIFSGTTSARLFAEGFKQLKQAAPSAGFKEHREEDGLVVEGAAGIVYSLPDGIYNQTDLKKKDYVTGARKSLRVTADGIEEMTKTLREHLGGMKIDEAGAAGPKPEEERKSEAKGGTGTASPSPKKTEGAKKQTDEAGGAGPKPEEGRKSEAVGGAGTASPSPNKTEGAKKRIDGFGEMPESPRKKRKLPDKREGEKRTVSVFRQNEDKNKNSGTIRVGLLNVRSLNDKTEDIRNLIRDNDLDVFLTTETWLQPDNADAVLRQASTSGLSSGSPPKFSFFHQERGDQGVAVISEALNPTHELEENKPKTFDYVAVELKHDKWVVPVQVAEELKRDCILFVNVYHRPGLEKLEAFLEEFESFLDKVHVKYKSVIVISDILADIRRFQNSFKSILDTRSFIHHVTELTHNIDDLLITKNVEISELKDEVTSDHYFFKFKARPKDANKEHEVQTMVVINIRSVDIDPSTIPNLMETKALDVFFATKKERKKEEDKKIEEQYKMYHSVWIKKGGGVAIQYRQDLQGERRRTNRNPETFEYVAAVLKHAEWIKPVLFINVYRPPGLTTVEIEAFLREFKKLLDELSVGYNSIIITGDFNIHVDVETETTTTMFEKFLEDNDLKQRVKESTHKKGHTLDLVIIKNVRISDPRVRTDISDISDHYPVTFNARPVLEDANEKTRVKKTEE